MLALAAAAVGFAVHVRDGNYHPFAITLIALACVATFGSLFVERPLPPVQVERLLAAIVLAQLVTIAVAPIAPGFPAKGAALVPFVLGVVLAALLVVGIAWPVPRLTRFQVPLLLLLFFLLGAWVIRKAEPVIDVYMFQQRASRALLHAKNPWALRFPNLYPDDRFYGPGLVVNGKLQFGYPYPPLPLLMVLPGWLAAKDVRWAHLVAMTIAGGLIAYARPGRVSSLAAALLLFTPRIFLVLLLGWIEPLVVVLLALVVFVAIRRPRALPVAFGAFLAVKQYLVFAVPLAFLLAAKEARPRSTFRLVLGAGAVVALLTVPFLLWNVHAFMHSVVTLQFGQPFRRDALSFAAWWVQMGGSPLASLAFVVTPPALAIAAVRAPRTPAGFAAAFAATYLVFFAFNKQAFCNYYLLVVGALAIAIAAMDPAVTSTSTVSSKRGEESS
jgi:hypothetical protein